MKTPWTDGPDPAGAGALHMSSTGTARKRREPPPESMLLPYAETLGLWGVAVIPLIGKTPLRKAWDDPPPPNAETIPPTATGLGIVLGSASGGLICRDFDQA